MSTNHSSRRNHWMSIQRPSCFFNLWSSCSSHQIQRRRGRLLPPPEQASPPPTTPIAGQGIPLLTHTPYYSAVTAASHRSRISEPSYSSPCGHPLPCLPRLRVVPFPGLAVVHHPGALGASWSTWSTNDMHQKWTVCGEADS